MGVDCRVTLPPGVRVNDVADVVGRLLGCPGELVLLGRAEADGVAVRVAGVEVRSYPSPGLENCAGVVVRPPHGRPWDCMYHFEWNDPWPGSRGMLLRSRPENVALFRRLVDFFGGRVDHADCDDTDNDYERPLRDPIAPTDGDEWDAFQRAILAVEPLTGAEIRACRTFAAYE